MKLLNKYGNEPWKEADDTASDDIDIDPHPEIAVNDDEIDEIDRSNTANNDKDRPAVFDLMNNQVIMAPSGMGLGDHRRHPPVTTNAMVQSHQTRKYRLIVHFQQMCLKNEVVWPRNNKKWQKYNPFTELARAIRDN